MRTKSLTSDGSKGKLENVSSCVEQTSRKKEAACCVRGIDKDEHSGEARRIAAFVRGLAGEGGEEVSGGITTERKRCMKEGAERADIYKHKKIIVGIKENRKNLSCVVFEKREKKGYFKDEENIWKEKAQTVLSFFFFLNLNKGRNINSFFNNS